MIERNGLLETTIETLDEGRQLRVARLGQGEPLVLLHGYPENLQVWQRLAPLLASNFHVIAFDWPGMGYSDAWPGGATPRHMAERLVRLLDLWELERVTVVGMDMGGQPALEFAARNPQRTTRLVVMNSLVFGDEKTSWEIRLLRRFGFNRWILRRFPQLVFHRAERTFLPGPVRLDAATRTDFWTAFARPAVRQFVSKMCAGYQGTLDQLPSRYTEISCPTLVLWAQRDKHFPLVQAERLHHCINRSQLQVVQDGTHWMPLLRADELAEHIRSWSLDHTSLDTAQ